MRNTTRLGISVPSIDRSDRPDIADFFKKTFDPAAGRGVDTSMVVYDTGTDAARLAAAHLVGRVWWTTDTHILWYDDGTTWRSLNPGLTSVTGQLGADVTMTNADQYYDGPSVSCVAGTWLLVASVAAVQGTGANGDVVGKLWNGTTVVSSAPTRSNNDVPNSLSLVGLVTPGSTTTYKVSLASQVAAAKILAAAPSNGAGNNASTLVGVRIA